MKQYETSLGKEVTGTYLEKYPNQKRADGVAQVVAYLPSKPEVQSSNLSTEKRKKNDSKLKLLILLPPVYMYINGETNCYSLVGFLFAYTLI
jgi:hypothetical protein